MATIFSGATVYTENGFINADILVDNGSIVSVGKSLDFSGCTVVDCSNKYIFPGFTDVHMHFREPGFSYKETIKSGSLAAARGGYTSVCTMPNLNPAPDSYENLRQQLDIIDKDALIKVYPYGTITKGQAGEELSDMSAMAQYVISFSDDGRGVQSDDMMLEAMKTAKALDKMIVAHCEVNDLLRGGYIHDGEYAKKNGHRGICSESEWMQIARDIELVKKTGVSYHVCHISAKESVDVIRKAKAEGVDITCETGPHYLVMNDCQLQEDGRFKMNPPIRSEEDRRALVAGILEGTVDMIATDHAPHSAEEKGRGLEKSLMGIVGLETSFPVMYTELVKTGVITLEKLIELMSVNPAKRFGLEYGIKEGHNADFCVFDLEKQYIINPDEFVSMGKATPFTGKHVFGKCVATVCSGNIVYKEQ
ncbi:MAG: dihydroorotase [Clostridia bacterium]|nr:dihydroorotase [Clostridia bacterium]